MNDLPYYQYNSGLRYGNYGDGAGQTGDPSLIKDWLGASTVRCSAYSPGLDGHGVLLTSGWKHGTWCLVELDLFNNKWKINDFTFGDRRTLVSAMQTDKPVLSYHAVK
jgi:hypothetical protein